MRWRFKLVRFWTLASSFGARSRHPCRAQRGLAHGPAKFVSVAQLSLPQPRASPAWPARSPGTAQGAGNRQLGFRPVQQVTGPRAADLSLKVTRRDKSPGGQIRRARCPGASAPARASRGDHVSAVTDEEGGMPMENALPGRWMTSP